MSAPLIGLTGGIGSGKSTAAHLFEQLGARLIDADEISRQLTAANGLAIPAIIQAFSLDYIEENGALKRGKMRELIFRQAEAKQQLQSILHPLILQTVQQQAQLASSAPYTLLVVPLLFESDGYRQLVQRTLVVDCSEATQIQRTMQRSGLSEEEVKQIIAQQIPRQQRLNLADDVLRNDDELCQLQVAIVKFHQHFLRLHHDRALT